jgi:hypothetical protein
MHDPKNPDGAAPPTEPGAPAEPDTATPGVFGIFANIYRPRWAAKQAPSHRADGTAESASGGDPVRKRTLVAEDGTRLIRPEDSK